MARPACVLMPPWITALAWISLAVCGACAVIIVTDIAAGHRQRMWIMNVVWPVTALYAGPLALWMYRAWARHGGGSADRRPFWQTVSIATTHCGAGCSLGDLIAEWGLLLVPFTLFGRPIFAAWLADFVLAFGLGIAFQYFTIVPMRHLATGAGIRAAIRADAFSLTAWQVGMYGWMALVTFVVVGRELPATSPVFWWMMQVGMVAGFLTSFPVNWWLVRSGRKEAM
ncbi:MAG: DUF4396 domain-containing protein [Gemmatimonadales bacterium]